MTLSSPVCAAKCPAGQHLVPFENILNGKMKQCQRLGGLGDTEQDYGRPKGTRRESAPDIYTSLRGTKSLNAVVLAKLAIAILAQVVTVLLNSVLTGPVRP